MVRAGIPRQVRTKGNDMMKHKDSSRFRTAGAIALGAALALPVAVAADDIPWVFSGSTNRVAVATASASSGSTLLTTLDNGAVESAPFSMSTCPPATLLYLR